MKSKAISVLFALVLALSLSLVTVAPAAAFPAEQTHTVTGDGVGGFTLAEMDQQFSTDTIDASAGNTTLSGSVILGNFDAGNGDDVWYEAGLVSNETYLGYSRLHNKGVYMIALWTGTGYIVHMQNVVGQQPQNTGNYLGDEDGYVDTWGDAGMGYFQVPNAAFDYELKYHGVTASDGNVDLRISVDGGTTWSGWKLYQYAEDDMETFYSGTLTPEEVAAYGYAGDDDLTDARIVSQIFVESTTTETFTAAYDNIEVNVTPYVLAPRVKNVDTGKGYTAIQLAIDAPETDANDTISVAAGTYVEEVIVDRPLTLLGANAGVPGYDTRVSESIIDADDTDVVSDDPATWVAAFFVTSGNVTIDGFKTVDADEGIHVACAYGGDESFWGDRENVVIKNNYIDTSEGYPQTHIAATGIIFYNDANWHTTPTAYSVSGALVQDNYIDQEHQKSSIFFQDVNGSITIKGNKIDGNPCDNGIILGATSALGFDMDLSGTVIEDNNIDGCDYGMQIKRVTTSSSPLCIGPDNNITGGGTGFRLWSIGSETVIQGNTITNNTKGFELGRGGADYPVNNVSILGNDILDNDIGIRIRDGGLGTGNEAHFNNIVGKDIGVKNEDDDTFDAIKNWWGDASGPDGAQVFPPPPENYIGVLPGTGNKVSANVKCRPWLTRKFQTVLEDDIAYFGISVPALKGWNIVSAPLALDAHVAVAGIDGVYATNTWGGLLNLGKIAEVDDYALKLHYTEDDVGKRTYGPIYYYDSDRDSPTFGWREATASTEVKPVDAYYIRMMASDSIPILFSPDLSVPSKKLYQGWNLVGCAYLDVQFAKDGQPLETALATIATVSSPAGDVKGYAQVVSPPVNQKPWIFIPPPPAGGTYIPDNPAGETILIGKGYWVFMENPGTLAGLTFTPISLPK